MSSIKGFSLKSIKTNVGHDGSGLSANIYFNNKKVGFIEDDGCGVGLEVTFMKNKEELQSIVDEYVDREDLTPYARLDKFFEKLVRLSLDEKEFKKAVKSGYKAYLRMDYYPRDENGDYSFEDKPIALPESYFVPTVEMANEMIAENKPTFHRLYSSLDDFNIL